MTVREPREIVFDDDGQRVATVFAGGLALARLALTYAARSEEPVSTPLLDIFVRMELNKQSEPDGTPVKESPRYDRHYFEYVCTLIADALTELGEEVTPEEVISDVFGIAATHASGGSHPVQVGVVPTDFSIPESWLEEG